MIVIGPSRSVVVTDAAATTDGHGLAHPPKWSGKVATANPEIFDAPRGVEKLAAAAEGLELAADPDATAHGDRSGMHEAHAHRVAIGIGA